VLVEAGKHAAAVAAYAREVASKQHSSTRIQGHTSWIAVHPVALKLVFTVPSVFSRATRLRVTPPMVVKDPAIRNLPSACTAIELI